MYVLNVCVYALYIKAGQQEVVKVGFNIMGDFKWIENHVGLNCESVGILVWVCRLGEISWLKLWGLKLQIMLLWVTFCRGWDTVRFTCSFCNKSLRKQLWKETIVYLGSLLQRFPSTVDLPACGKRQCHSCKRKSCSGHGGGLGVTEYKEQGKR